MATAATWMTSAEYSPKTCAPAQQVALAPFHDQLAEVPSVAVDHGAEQVVIADDRDRAVVTFARLGLGQPDAGVFGVGGGDPSLLIISVLLPLDEALRRASPTVLAGRRRALLAPWCWRQACAASPLWGEI